MAQQDRNTQLQLAIDVLSTRDALTVAEKVYPYCDIVEIGTPLIIEEGVHALTAIKEKFPDKTYLADLKIMDAGDIEADSGFSRGADIVTVLAAADDITIQNALFCREKYGGQIMADLINVAKSTERAKQLQDIGVDIICVHTAYDVQSEVNNPLAELKTVRPAISCKIAVAGGLKRKNIEQVIDAGADIVIVGSAITKHADPKSEAKAIYDIIHKD